MALHLSALPVYVEVGHFHRNVAQFISNKEKSSQRHRERWHDSFSSLTARRDCYSLAQLFWWVRICHIGTNKSWSKTKKSPRLLLLWPQWPDLAHSGIRMMSLRSSTPRRTVGSRGFKFWRPAADPRLTDKYTHMHKADPAAQRLISVRMQRSAPLERRLL